MTRPIPYLALSVLLVITSVLLLSMGARAFLMPSWPRAVDRPSYAAGWTYVVNRQPGSPSATPGVNWIDPRTDGEIRTNCRLYADGFAQLDGVRDVDDFLAGCDDAAAATRLGPETGR